MKPDWKDAPEWAKYLSSDSDGWYCWSEKKPKLAYHEKFWVYVGKFEYCELEPTIEERPE